MTVRLSCAQVPGFAKDFCFVVHKHKYYCNKSYAIMVSGKVASLIEKNPGLKRIAVRYDDRYGAFNDIYTLMNGGSLNLDDGCVDCPAILAMARELAMDEIEVLIQSFIWSKREVTKENVFQIMAQKKGDRLDIERELTFLAENFDTVVLEMPENIDAFFNLGVEGCASVVSNKSFACEDHGELLTHIVAHGRDFWPLFEFLDFGRVMSREMKLFCDTINTEAINDALWSALGKRLVLNLGAEPERKERIKTDGANTRTITFSGSHKDGIIAYLTAKHQGNIADQKVVRLTATETETIFSSCELRYILNLSNDSEFYCSKRKSQDSAPYFQIDFCDLRVKPNSYSLGTYVFGKDNQHLKSWVLEGSVKGDGDWEVMDRRSNDTQLNGMFLKAHYDMASPPSRPVRFVRLTMTGPSHRNDWELLCSFIELFGVLIE